MIVLLLRMKLARAAAVGPAVTWTCITQGRMQATAITHVYAVATKEREHKHRGVKY